jgi:hypothetical protein
LFSADLPDEVVEDVVAMAYDRRKKKKWKQLRKMHQKRKQKRWLKISIAEEVAEDTATRC